MKNIKDLKQKLSTWLAWLMAISAILTGSSYAAGFPSWLTTVFGILILVGPVTNLFLTGRNNDLSKKTDEQLKAQKGITDFNPSNTNPLNKDQTDM